MDKLAGGAGKAMGMLEELAAPFNLHGILKSRLGNQTYRLGKLKDKLLFQQVKNMGSVPEYAALAEKVKRLQGRKSDLENSGKALALIAGGSTVGAVGIGGLYASLQNAIKNQDGKEINKIKTSLALQELQSDTGTEETAFGKNSIEKQALIPQQADALKLMGLGAGVTTAAAIPAAISWKWLRDLKAAEKKNKIKQDINRLRKLYDAKFKESVLEDMNVDPAALKETTAIMSKTSGGTYDFIVKHAPELGVGAAGVGLGMGAFLEGKKHGDQSSENIQQMKAYREMLDRITRLRNSPVIVTDSGFSPEEMVALHKLRTESSSKKPKKVVKDKKVPEAEPKKVSAATNDSDLQELLSSV